MAEKKINNPKMNQVLRKYAGAGRVGWQSIRNDYIRVQGTHFGDTLRAYARQWPDRVIIDYNYNVTDGAFVTIKQKSESNKGEHEDG